MRPMIFSGSCSTRELCQSVLRMTHRPRGFQRGGGMPAQPSGRDVEAAADWMSWFASVLRSQRSDGQLVRDSVGRAILREDAQRGEVHRQ